jgi:hypothetical protein
MGVNTYQALRESYAQTRGFKWLTCFAEFTETGPLDAEIKSIFLPVRK